MAEPDPILAELRLLRILQGKTQRDVARIAGVQHESIYTWETGRKVPSLSNARAFAAALGYELVVQPREEE